MSPLRFHVGHALRSLRRSPGYVLAFVVTFGLAVGVNSAVFSMVNGVLLQPLPFQDGDRILYLKQPATARAVDNMAFSFMEIDDYRAASSSIDEFVEFGDWSFTVIIDAEPSRAVGGLVTSNFFDVLGMRPNLGRLLNGQDDITGAEPVMLITHDYWERAFGSDPSVLGRTVDLIGTAERVPTRIVGVLEPGLHYTGTRRPDFYVNYATNDHYEGAAMRDSRGHRMTDVFARMAPGVTLPEVRAELTGIASQLHAAYPEAYRADMGFGIEAVPWQEELTRRGRTTFILLMAAVGVILVLAAANVMNLTLTRLIRKEGELSTRSALGASGLDLRLHFTVENALMGLAGGMMGVAMAYVARDSLAAYASRFTVRAQEVGIDWTVFGVTLGGAMLVSSLLAWAPGLPVNPGSEGSASARSKATAGRRRRRVQRTLVVSQLALSFALLTGAGLLVRSLIHLTSVDPGFETEQILTFDSQTGNFAGFSQDEEVFRQALDEIRSYPGVRSAATAQWLPLEGREPVSFAVRIDGAEEEIERSYLGSSNAVSEGFFETLDIPLVAGRYIDARDREETADVIVINRSMAEDYFGNEDPIGRRMSFSTGGNWSPDLEVVGVVADAQEYGMSREGVHTMYRPATQVTYGPSMLVATIGEPTALTQYVRDVFRRLDPNRAVDDVQTLAARRDQDVAPSRLNAVLFGSFAALALLIAALGVLAALAFSVSQRFREFGIRMAVGADRGSVLRSVLGEGLILLAGALVLGAGAALVLGGAMADFLFEVQPTDPLTMALAGTVLGVVALAATLLPALRATRIDPCEALRAE